MNTTSQRLTFTTVLFCTVFCCNNLWSMQNDGNSAKRRKVEATQQDDNLVERKLQQEFNQKLIDAIEKDDITTIKAMCDITTRQDLIESFHAAPHELYNIITSFLPPVNLNLPTKRNEFVLHKAAEKGNPVIIDILINAGADLEIKDLFYNRTALHVAASNGNIAVILILLVHNAQINVFDAERETPLHKAVRNTHTDVVRLLIKHKANPFICSKPLIFYPIPLPMQQTPRDVALQQIRTIDDMRTNTIVFYKAYEDNTDEDMIYSKNIHRINKKLLKQYEEYCRIYTLLESYEKTLKN